MAKKDGRIQEKKLTSSSMPLLKTKTSQLPRHTYVALEDTSYNSVFESLQKIWKDDRFANKP